MPKDTNVVEFVFDQTHDRADIERLLQGSPWINREGFEFSSIEGYKSGVFGYKSGPSYNIEALYHEIAHAIELMLTAPEKLEWRGFAFYSPEEYIFGRFICEPTTTGAIERELRAASLQWLMYQDNALIDPGSLERFKKRWVSICGFMPDIFNVRYLYDPSTEEAGSWEARKDFERQWIEDQIDSNLERFATVDLKAAWVQALERIQESRVEAEAAPELAHAG